MTIDNQQSWQRASLTTFEINKEGPYLDRDLATSNTQNAYQKDHKNGYEDGIKQAQQELMEYKQTFETIFANFDNALKEIDQDVIQTLTELALSISKQVIRRELETNSEQVVSIVREAIALLPFDKNRLIMHLNPNDVEIIQKIFNQDDIKNSYSIVEDVSIQRGGCKLETDNSVIDATIDSQITQIAVKMLGGQRADDLVGDG